MICCCWATKSCLTLCNPMDCNTAGFPCPPLPPPNLLRLMSIESLILSNHSILCHPFLFLPSIIPSIRISSKESPLRVRWPRYWSFSFSISRSNEYSGLISFRIDWFDLLAVQRTLKSLLQHHSSKASIFWSSVFFTVQLSHLQMTTGKIITLIKWTFVSEMMTLLFNCCLSLPYFPSKEQVSLNFMAPVTVHSDFWSPRKENLSLVLLFPLLLPM